jgi:hypothetical protein
MGQSEIRNRNVVQVSEANDRPSSIGLTWILQLESCNLKLKNMEVSLI